MESASGNFNLFKSTWKTELEVKLFKISLPSMTICNGSLICFASG